MTSCFISPSCQHFQNVIDIFDLHNTESTEDLFFSTPKQFFFLGGGEGGGAEHGFSDESVISCQYFSTGFFHYLTGGLF